MTLIDTHAHLDDDRFRDDLPAVLERASAAGVERALTIGIDRATSEAAVELAQRYPMLHAVVGIQPNSVGEAGPGDLERVFELALHPRVVAIGETGLDRYWDRAPFALQEEFFVRHLALAEQIDRPVVIHCREAEADVVRVLKAEFERRGPIRGVMHSFTGDRATAEQCLAMGLHLSFAGMATFKANEGLRAVAARVPEDRILVETDSPYLAPVPHRGKRNEPANVVHTAACLAEALGISLDELASRTTRNAQKLFRLEIGGQAPGRRL
jgi:TatD DNase family protein